MNKTAILIVLASTVCHASWNFLARRERAEHTFLLRSLGVMFALGFIPILALELLLPPLPSSAWRFVLLSGTFSGVYYFGLARAYSSGDFTVVYPFGRSLPVILVVLGDVARGRFPTTAGWFGILLVVGACLIIPLESLKRWPTRCYLNRTMAWVFLVAAGIVGFTLVDKVASEVVQATLPGPVSAARYCYRFFAVTALVYTLCLKLFGAPSEETSRVGWKRPALAALFNFGSYGLMLWACQLAERAGYIVAFRQFSIIIGMALAMRFLNERGVKLRLLAACTMCAGLVLIALYGQ